MKHFPKNLSKLMVKAIKDFTSEYPDFEIRNVYVADFDFSRTSATFCVECVDSNCTYTSVDVYVVL